MLLIKICVWLHGTINICTLFDYPKDLVYVGCPIADLIRYNAERGECGPGPVEEHVHKRIHWMKVGSAHGFERIRKDGLVIQMRGNPY